MPLVPVPLLPPDEDAALDVGRIVQAVHVRRGYAWRIDYRQPVPPPDLRPAASAWVREQLAARDAQGTG